MKKYYLNIIILLLIFNYSVKSIELIPLLLDYKGVEANKELQIIYCNNGCILIQDTLKKTWVTKKIFDKGLIIKVFIEDNRVVVINEFGEIALSYDKCITWEYLELKNIINEDNRNYYYFITTDNYYYLRNFSYTFVIDKNFKVINKVESKFPQKYVYHLNHFVTNSIAVDDKYVIIVKDSAKIELYNIELNYIKTINFLNSPEYNFLPLSNYNILSTSRFYFFSIGSELYKMDKNFENIKLVFNSKDYYNNDNYLYNSYPEKVIEDKVFLNVYADFQLLSYIDENTDSVVKVKYHSYDNYVTPYRSSTMVFRDFTIYDNNFIGVEKNLIVTSKIDLANIDLSNTTTNIISQRSNIELDGLNIFNSNIENFNNDLDSIIIYNGLYNDFELGLSKVKVNDNLFQSIVNYDSLVKYKGYFDNFSLIKKGENQLNYILGNDGRLNYVLETDNNWKNFKKKFLIDSITKELYGPDIPNSNTIDLKEFDNNKMIIVNEIFSSSFNTIFYYFDKNFNFIKDFKKWSFSYNLINFKDYSKCKIIGYNYISNNFEIIETKDTFKTWNDIYVFDKNVQILKIENLEFKNKWIIYSINHFENKIYLHSFDLSSNTLDTLFSYVPNNYEKDNLSYLNLCIQQNKIYLNLEKKLILVNLDADYKFLNNLEFIFPNNGNIKSKMYVYGKTLLARYEDDKNEDNFYWINGIDLVGPPTSVENTIEEVNYLYTLPPYPNPTTNSITTKLYWDISIDLNIENIGIYDIMGNKINLNDNIRLEKFNNYIGNIIWDTSNQPKGTYLLKIQHGNNTKSVKIMVE